MWYRFLGFYDQFDFGCWADGVSVLLLFAWMRYVAGFVDLTCVLVDFGTRCRVWLMMSYFVVCLGMVCCAWFLGFSGFAWCGG